MIYYLFLISNWGMLSLLMINFIVVFYKGGMSVYSKVYSSKILGYVCFNCGSDSNSDRSGSPSVCVKCTRSNTISNFLDRFFIHKYLWEYKHFIFSHRSEKFQKLLITIGSIILFFFIIGILAIGLMVLWDPICDDPSCRQESLGRFNADYIYASAIPLNVIFIVYLLISLSKLFYTFKN